LAMFSFIVVCILAIWAFICSGFALVSAGVVATGVAVTVAAGVAVTVGVAVTGGVGAGVTGGVGAGVAVGSGIGAGVTVGVGAGVAVGSGIGAGVTVGVGAGGPGRGYTSEKARRLILGQDWARSWGFSSMVLWTGGDVCPLAVLKARGPEWASSRPGSAVLEACGHSTQRSAPL